MLNQREETELDGLKQLFQVHFVLFTFRRLPACRYPLTLKDIVLDNPPEKRSVGRQWCLLSIYLPISSLKNNHNETTRNGTIPFHVSYVISSLIGDSFKEGSCQSTGLSNYF